MNISSVVLRLNNAVRRSTHYLSDRRKFTYTSLAVLSVALLAASVLYGAHTANQSLIDNSDDIVYRYLFEDFATNDLSLPAGHSNVLKFPLFALQAALPYNHTTFILVGYGLSLITILVWAGLLAYLFGKRAIPLICLGLSAIILASPSFNSQIYGTTIRNIEYPVALAFMIVIARLAIRRNDRLPPKPKLAVGILIVWLFGLAGAGDSLILYQTGAAVLLTLGVLWATMAVRTKDLLIALTVLGVGCLLGPIIRHGFVAGGVMHLADNINDQLHTPSIEALAPSISTAARQTLDMFGANILSKPLAASQAISFALLALLAVASTLCVVCIVKMLRPQPSRTKLPGKNLADLVMLMGCFALLVTIGLYILSDQVVVPAPTGGFAAAGRERYLTFVPLLAVLAIAYWVSKQPQRRLFHPLTIPAGLLLVLLASHGTIAANQQASAQSANAYHQSIKAVASELRSQNIRTYVSGYWYGSSVRFNLPYEATNATMFNCNVAFPDYNTRASWYKPDASLKKVGLLIDRSGPDSKLPGCTDERLVALYGMPSQKRTVSTPGYRVDVWTYGYDIRQHLILSDLAKTTRQ